MTFRVPANGMVLGCAREMRGILWCPHCGGPHKLGTTRCDATGRLLERRVHAAHPLVDTVIDGKYKVVGTLGRGGIGTVFEALDQKRNKHVAIKIVSSLHRNEELYARLLREAYVMADIRHPTICRLYAVGAMPDGSPYLV